MSYTIEVDSWIGETVKNELVNHGWDVTSHAVDPGGDCVDYITVKTVSKLRLVQFLKRKEYDFVIE